LTSISIMALVLAFSGPLVTRPDDGAWVLSFDMFVDMLDISV